MINMALVLLPNLIRLMSQNLINANCYPNYLDLFSRFLSSSAYSMGWSHDILLHARGFFLSIRTFFFHWRPPSWAPLRHFERIISLLQWNGSNYNFPAEIQRLIHSWPLFRVWQCGFLCGPWRDKIHTKCCGKTSVLGASVWTGKAICAM